MENQTSQTSRSLPTFTIPDAPGWRDNLSACLDKVQPGDTISCATLEQYEVTQERIRSLRLGGSILFVRPDGTEWTETQSSMPPIAQPAIGNVSPNERKEMVSATGRDTNAGSFKKKVLPFPSNETISSWFTLVDSPQHEPVELSPGKEVVVAGMRCRIETIDLDFDAINYLSHPMPGASMTLYLKPLGYQREREWTRVRAAFESGQYDYPSHVSSPTSRWNRDFRPRSTFFYSDRIYIVADSMERAKEFCDLAGIPSTQRMEIVMCGEGAPPPSFLRPGETLPDATVFYDSSARNASNEFRHYLGTCRVTFPFWIGRDYNYPPENEAQARARQYEGMLNLASELNNVARLTTDRRISGNSLRSAELLRTHVKIAQHSERLQHFSHLSTHDIDLIRRFAECGIAPKKMPEE